MIDSEEWVEYTDENGKSHDGIIRADENGYLIIDDWYQNQDGSWNYYKKDFLRAENEVVEKYGKQYYLDSDGILVTNSQLTIGGQLYQADASGAITLIQASAKEHWVKTNGNGTYLLITNLLKINSTFIKGIIIILTIMEKCRQVRLIQKTEKLI